MVRFIHSADWQLGARFQQFGPKAEALRAARLATLRRTLLLAREEAVDALLIAGDLFEDNQVHDDLVAAALDLFREFPSVRVYILPGNHDPFTGPDSVWQRRLFFPAPENVHVLRESGTLDLGGNAFLLSSLLRQKLSTHDPSQPLIALSAALPPDAIRIGITHGALAIEGKHQPNDFPIALKAASRAGLDYLAIGHWHNWWAETDGGRIVMPGTPEPDRFSNDRSGQVALVEISERGAVPKVKACAVATLTWKNLSFDFLSPESSRATLKDTFAALQPNASQTVVRLTLTGTASPTARAGLQEWLASALKPFLIGQVIDNSSTALDPAELEDLQRRHPILAHVLDDLARLESIDGVPSTLMMAEAQSLLATARLEASALPPGFFDQVRQLTLQTLREEAQ